MMIPHLDEEALSAALDDEGSPEEMAHLAGCRQCQAGVARLAVLARTVGTPIAARSTADVTAAVDRALAARDDPAAPPVGVRGAAGGSPRTIPPVPSGRPAVRNGLRAHRWFAPAAGLAAAVLVVAAVAGIMKQAGRPTRNTTSAAAPYAGSASTAARGFASSTIPGDLGDQSDPASLARTVRGLLSVSEDKTAQAASPPPASGTASAQRTGAAPPCAAEGRLAAGIAGAGTEAPSFVASLRWRGQPAVLLVYRGPAGSVGVVMRMGDCARLTQFQL